MSEDTKETLTSCVTNVVAEEAAPRSIRRIEYADNSGQLELDVQDGEGGHCVHTRSPTVWVRVWRALALRQNHRNK